MISPAENSKKHPIRLSDLLSLRFVESPSADPAGNRAVCSIRTIDAARDTYRSHLWLVTPDSARPLTRGEVEDSSPRWSPDGNRIAFTSDRGEKRGIWILDLDGGEPRLLFHNKILQPTSLTWSPSGDRIAFLGVPIPLKPEGDQKAGDGDVRLRRIRRPAYRSDEAGWLAEETPHVYVVDVARAGDEKPLESARQITRGFASDESPAWSPDGRWIAYSSLETKSADEADLTDNRVHIFVCRADGTGEPRQITRTEGGWFKPVWSPNGRWVAVVGHTHTDDVWGTHAPKLWIFSSQGDEGTCLTSDLDRPADDFGINDLNESDASSHFFTQDGSEILFPVSDRGAILLYRVKIDQSGRRTSAPEIVLGGPRIVSDVQLTAGGLSGLLSGPLELPEVFGAPYRPGATSVDPVRWTGFTDSWINSLELREPEEFVTKASDGQEVHGWILSPIGWAPSDGPPPALLEIHGGPHAQYGWSFMFEFHYLAAQGYTVIFSNPRGSQGYGDDFSRPVREHFGKFAELDLHAVVDYAVAKGLADPKRLGVLGGSGGGYLTSWLIGQSDRFRAACSQRALNDWRTFFCTSDMGWHSAWQTGTLPWQDTARLRDISPLYHADRMKTPLLIVHSEQDLRCSIEQAEQLYVWLRWQGKPVEFLRFPEESHGLSRIGTPSRRLERLRAIKEWFDRYLMTEGTGVTLSNKVEVENS